jgi:urease accessory protein
MKTRLLSIILLYCLLPALAQAHEVAGGGSGFLSGLSHPVLGLDHLLAMISVGILSAQLGGRAIWTVPTTFVSVMLLGGVLGMKNIPFVSVELGIAVSVLSLGIALATDKKMPIVFAMIFVAFFALFHGHAHGTEMPYLAEPFVYAAGFVVGTAAIHIAGVFIGLTSKLFSSGSQLLRYAGAGIAGIGFHLIIQ